MLKNLTLIHTSISVIPLFNKKCQEILPRINTNVIADGSLIKETIAKNKVTTNTAWRLINYIKSAEQAGADVILVTCSSVGQVVEASQSFFDLPVLRIDEPMVDKALSIGQNIGLIASLPTTLYPTMSLLEAKAAKLGKKIHIKPVLCDCAFEAFSAGDIELHDQIVGTKLTILAKEVDVIILAQASLASVAENYCNDNRIPILSSPSLALERIKEYFDEK